MNWWNITVIYSEWKSWQKMIKIVLKYFLFCFDRQQQQCRAYNYYWLDLCRKSRLTNCSTFCVYSLFFPMQYLVGSSLGHAITSTSVSFQTGPHSCLYVGGISFTKTVNSMTNLSNIRFEFSQTVFWLMYVLEAHSLQHQYPWLLVLVMNFSPWLSCTFCRCP